MNPWYYEPPGPSLFNAWSFPHFMSGAFFSRFVDLPVGLIGHTLYESVEGAFKIARTERDTSALNHVGDTIAFAAGFVLAQQFVPKWSDPSNMEATK